MKNQKKKYEVKRLRTVTVNDRGQIVIPEEIRESYGIKKDTTLVLIEKGNDIIIKQEKDVIKTMSDEQEEKLFWRAISDHSLSKMWSKEDEIWDKLYKDEK